MSETDRVASRGRVEIKGKEHHEDEKSKIYTTMFFQKPLGFKAACAWVFFHYMAVGAIQGYYTSVQFSLQANGANLTDQSTLSLALYPYSVKFLFSPLLDRFFIRNMGRSKTYIIIGGIVMASVFCFLGPTIETMVKNTDVIPLTVLFCLVNVMVCVVQIAGEAWILTMFNKDTKTQATTFLSTGQSLGAILGYNVFTPLNDTSWLNENFFHNEPRSSPLVTHAMFCIAVAIFIFAQIAFNLLFIAEEKITDKKSQDILKILAIVPRHVTNKHMRGLIGFMFGCRFFNYMLEHAYDFKLVRNGYLNVSRSVISNIDTITFPIVFVFSLSTVYYLKKGQLIRMFHLNMCVVIINGAFRFINYLNLVENRDYEFVLIARLFSGIIQGMDLGTVFMISFFNTIVNKAVGNTGITCLIALLNQTASFSNTIGLLLIGKIGYEPVVVTCLSLQAILLLIMRRYVDYLDNKDSKLFDISEPTKPDNPKASESERFDGKSMPEHGSPMLKSTE
jgi:MFS transporter, PAT family, solute carrier family 33 (acetyl-CoA transportor), member 1